MTDQTISQQVLARAIKDAAFRQALVSDPKGVLAREFNFKVADSVTIRVVEDTSTTHTIVLPAQEAEVKELSDAELETIAGGLANTGNAWCKPLPSEATNCLTCNGCW